MLPREALVCLRGKVSLQRAACRGARRDSESAARIGRTARDRRVIAVSRLPRWLRLDRSDFPGREIVPASVPGGPELQPWLRPSRHHVAPAACARHDRRPVV